MLILQSAHSQTNVSGGIYTNTTWTHADSPYILVDNVVVFPGVILTIQPGVTIRFADQKILEIREAKLIAVGTNTDSITFTSNASSPIPGMYSGIRLNGGNLTSTFSYCRFSFASTGINATVSDSLIIRNSDFMHNLTGMQFIGNTNAGVAMMNNSVFNQNTNEGLILKGLEFSGINSCTFINNRSEGLILDDLYRNMSATIENSDFSSNSTGLLSCMHFLNMNACNFTNNENGMEGSGYLSPHDTYHNLTRNCVFNFNHIGIAYMARMTFDNCTMNHNQAGIASGGVNCIKNCTIDSNNVQGISTYNDSVLNCSIRYNGEGIHTGSVTVITGNSIEYNSFANISCGSGITSIEGNTIRYGNIGIDNVIAGTLTISKNIIENNNLGINLASSNTSISCNRICNNNTFDLKYGAMSNLEAGNNYWCTPDSTSTEVVIYDGYDNINYGLVSFMPIDSLCYTITGVEEIEINNNVKVFPNPFSKETVIHTDKGFKNATITLFNLSGQQIRQFAYISGEDFTLRRDKLPTGLYLLKLILDDKILIKKLIITDN